MLDPQLLRTDLGGVARRLSDRGYILDVQMFESLESERKAIQTETQDLQARRNQLSKSIGLAKGKGEDASGLMAQVNAQADQLKALEHKLAEVQGRLGDFLQVIPNLPHSSVPPGSSSEDNLEVRKVGAPRAFDFPVQDHVDIGAQLGMLDFDAAGRIAGSRFAVMKGTLARLHRALAQLMLDVHTEQHGYTEVYVPYMVTGDSANGVSSLAKFKDDLFKIEGRDLYLIPTAEYPVTNLMRDAIVPGADLPLKLVCHSPCFRSEAGSYGKDTRGMIRQHQFDKVELVQVVHPRNSYEALEELTGHAEIILKMLELPYRVVTLCTADIGFSAAKTYDLEVWLPGQSAYREISSCSNFEAFQSRRMQARFRNEKGKPELVHTLNGSGLAVGRTLVAVLETYQRADGSVDIPAALRRYMGDAEVLRA